MKTLKTIISLIVVFLLVGCASQKDVVYLQDLGNTDKNIGMKQTFDIKIQPDDLLGITVNSRDITFAAQFNMPLVGYQLGRSTTSMTAEQATTTNTLQGYLVDEKGDINFPVFGKIRVAGMTRTQLSKLLEDRLRDDSGDGGAYLKDAIVTVKYLNFKISVLGEVNRPGNFSLNSDRITIFEALALAGDMNIYGQRDNVMVLRDNGNGQTKSYSVNLKSSNVLNSPAYYLQQNDVVYVIPNNIKAQQSGINQNNNVSVWLSIASVLTSVAILIFK
ncbi:MAG: polysaccharide biosynthesis/export family protein [Flavobacteriales bacterium]|nr:polysaccharide biosynthesis/export family protein [Flavobacteriales bacterium]